MQAIKFKERSLWIIIGVAWLCIALLNLVFLGFMMSSGMIGMQFIQIEVIANVIITTALGIYYLDLKNIDYIRISEKEISIHRSLLLGRKNIDFADIEEGRRISNKLVMILANSKEFEIKFDLLSIRDMDMTIGLLSEKMQIT